jgi:hypothetical protein
VREIGAHRMAAPGNGARQTTAPALGLEQEPAPLSAAKTEKVYSN